MFLASLSHTAQVSRGLTAFYSANGMVSEVVKWTMISVCNLILCNERMFPVFLRVKLELLSLILLKPTVPMVAQAFMLL